MTAEQLTVLSLVAGVCTSVSMGFQTWKVLRTRQTQDISLMMYLVLTLGLALWLIYGIGIGDIALIFSNIVAGACAGVTLFCKIKWEHFAK